MAVSAEETDRVLDLFADLGDLSTKRMFGGLAIYHRGTIFALLHSDGRLMIKGAGDLPEKYEAMGLTRWTYTRPDGKSATMPYWDMPDSAIDDPDEACALARAALAEL